jgi:SAM-dependent methyltransferase
MRTEVMDPKHLDELIAVEHSYWWHVAKRELVLEMLLRHSPHPGILIEGGVGGGANAVAFDQLGYEVRGFDLMPDSVAHCRAMGFTEFHTHDLQEPWPVAAGSARAVVMLDVIEHVPDPVKVLRNAAAALAPDGGMVVTVPAIPALMGPWDRMLGHHRRYSRRLFREHARQADLRVLWLSHWNSFTLPAAAVVRTAERLTGCRRTAEFPRVSPRVNSLLIRLARFERRAMSYIPIILGLSLVGVLKHGWREEGRAQALGRGHRLGGAPALQRGASTPNARA